MKYINFLEYLKNNNWYVDCPGCKKRLFKVKSPKSKEDIIKAEDFMPVSDKIPPPVDGEDIRCPFCGAALVFVATERRLSDEKV